MSRWMLRLKVSAYREMIVRIWKYFPSILILWNSLVMLLLLWRQQTTVVRTDKLVVQSFTLSLERPTIGSKNLYLKKYRHEHLNVPDIYFNQNTKIKNYQRNLLTKTYFPDIQDIRFNNIYWQLLSVKDATFYLFGAYYDKRPSKLDNNVYVRIIGMVDTTPPPTNIRCGLWYSSGQRMVWAKSVVSEHLWRKYWGNVNNHTLQPYLISCLLPDVLHNGTIEVPEMVSLVSMESLRERRKPSTNLKVNYIVGEPKKDFLVCVKGLDFPNVDLSWRLLEWVHLLRLLGADKIIFYELEVHPNVSIVLEYMEKHGMAEVLPLTLPGNQPNLRILRSLYLKKMLGKKRLNEIIPYNDCLYKNLYLYKYILLLDIDEVLMPTSSVDWRGLMDQIQSIVQLNKPKDYKAASYNVRNVYFFNDLHNNKSEVGIPEYLYMTRHVVRSQEFTKRGRYIKCFHDISRVKALHNHYPLSCLPGFPCVSFDVSPLMAQLQHYRQDCQDIKAKDCLTKFKNKTVVDLNIWRYKSQLMQLVSDDIKKLREIIN